MRNEKGFTLIEVLAIIVVLSIIAVITVPVISKVLKNSRKSVAKDSAYGYKKVIDKFYYDNYLSGSNQEFGNRRYSSEDLKELGMSFSGREPESNSWVDIVDDDVVDGCLQFGEYMVNIGYNYVGDAEKGQCDSIGAWNQTVFPTVLKSVGEISYYDSTWIKSHPIYYNPVNNSKCSSSDSSSAFGTSSGCMKWYAYSESNGKVNMLLDHNLINEEWVDEEDDTNQSMPNELLSVLNDETSTWSSKLVRNDSYSVNWNYGGNNYSLSVDYSNKKARLLSAEEISEITENSSWSREGNDYYFGSNGSVGYLDQTPEQMLRQERYSWLFDNMSECDSFGCDNPQEDVYSYWAITPKTSTDNEVWCVCNEGCLDTNESTTSWVGLRPVISVSKSTVY